MKFILVKWVKYYTKEAVKTLKLIAIGSAIVFTVVIIKYKPAYKVTIAGDTIGFIANRELMEAKIHKYMNDTSGNIAFREIQELPKYEFKLINRNNVSEEKNVMLAVKDLTITTYRIYAITLDDERKAVVSSKEDAENIISQIKENLNEEVDLNLGIIEIYETQLNVISKEDAKNILNELKVAKVTEYEQKKAEQEKAAKEAEEREKAAKSVKLAKNKSYATATSFAPTGNLDGISLSIPVTGSISSRFGSRSSSRSSIHTGLDIATSLGTGIKPIASGTVTYAAYRGSYGNLIIIDHGNGIQSYYAHCNAIYVSPGQYIDSSSTIGAVGSTGNSTGPHLHLEIRINGSPVNPQNYLYK